MIDDSLLTEVRKSLELHGKISVPFLQRKYKINFKLATEIINLLNKTVLTD